LEAAKEKEKLRSIKSDEMKLHSHKEFSEKVKNDFAKLNKMDKYNRTNKRAMEIKKKLNNPLLIGDLIIAQEILNKPKALRR